MTVDSNLTFTNGSYEISNRTLIIDSTVLHRISIRLKNSTLLLENSTLELNATLAGSYPFRLYGNNSTLIVSRSKLIDSPAAGRSGSVIQMAFSTIIIGNAILTSSSGSAWEKGRGAVKVYNSYLYGNGTNVRVSGATGLLISGTTIIENGTLTNESYSASGAIEASSTGNLLLENSSIYIYHEDLEYGLYAENTESAAINNTYFSFNNINSSVANFDKYGIAVIASSSVYADGDILSGNSISLSITGSKNILLESLRMNFSYEGIVLTRDGSVDISSTEFAGGTYAAFISLSLGIRIQDSYVSGSLFGLRLSDVRGALLENIFEQFVISALQIVESSDIRIESMAAELVPYEFNFLEFFGITEALSYDVNITGVRLLTEPDASGGFIDGISLLYANNSTLGDSHILFSGEFVSTAISVYGSENDTVYNSTVISEGTSGDTGLRLYNSTANDVSSAEIGLIGQQALLLQNSPGNSFSDLQLYVDGTSTTGIYMYDSNDNTFSGTSITSEGYNSETGITFQNSSDNSFKQTYLLLTGSFAFQTLVKSMDSVGNRFSGFTYYSAYVNLKWMIASFSLSFMAAAGTVVAAIPRKKRLMTRAEERIYSRMKL